MFDCIGSKNGPGAKSSGLSSRLAAGRSQGPCGNPPAWYAGWRYSRREAGPLLPTAQAIPLPTATLAIRQQQKRMNQRPTTLLAGLVADCREEQLICGDERKELRRLRCENRQLREDLEILREPPPSSRRKPDRSGSGVRVRRGGEGAPQGE